MFDENIKSEIINIGPDESVTINELYQILSNQVQFNQDAIYEPRPNEVKKLFVHRTKPNLSIKQKFL